MTVSIFQSWANFDKTWPMVLGFQIHVGTRGPASNLQLFRSAKDWIFDGGPGARADLQLVNFELTSKSTISMDWFKEKSAGKPHI